MADLAAALARVITTPHPIPAADLDHALLGYQATLDLARHVHRDLTGSSQRATPRLISEAERNPIGLLGRLLHDVPRIHTDSAITVLDCPVNSAAGRDWSQVARHAVLAATTWQTSDPTSRPTGSHARAELADLAALTQGVLATTDTLTASLDHTGRRDQAAQVRHVRASGLAIAAELTQRHTTTHPTPAPAELVGPDAARVLVPRVPHDVPEALRRLATQLRGTTSITPRDVELIAQTTAGTAHHASQTLARTGIPADTAIAGMLRQHAELFARATDTTRRLAALDPSDPKPVLQTQALHQHLAAARRAVMLPPTDVARAIAAELPDLTGALDHLTRRQLDQGRWLTPTEGNGPWTWAPAHRVDHEPRIARHIRAATDHIHAPGAREVLPKPARGASIALRPRQILDAALDAAQSHQQHPRGAARRTAGRHR
ncbi:MAG: hypothetical protein JNL54_04340 [Kineosporiaceae bacterium]|nr:hypothetical protein [Kineosporiaceae bacterium]